MLRRSRPSSLIRNRQRATVIERRCDRTSAVHHTMLNLRALHSSCADRPGAVTDVRASMKSTDKTRLQRLAFWPERLAAVAVAGSPALREVDVATAESCGAY